MWHEMELGPTLSDGLSIGTTLLDFTTAGHSDVKDLARCWTCGSF